MKIISLPGLHFEAKSSRMKSCRLRKNTDPCIGDLQMFNNWYEDAMNNSKDEEILEDG